MSIIYDALKKVEKNTGKNSSGREGSSVKKPKPILIFVFVILLVIFAGSKISGLFTRPKPAFSPVAVAVNPVNNIPLPATEEKTIPDKEPVKIPEPILHLNGIFFQKDKGYALINNQILNVKDTIQGATVKEINLNKVVLEFEGREINLVTASQ